METDPFFYQLFKSLPQTLFELLGLPAEGAQAYRFDSVELKKSFRIDGLFLPKATSRPLYFVEVQFQRVAAFYANLFAKVFCYLEENDPEQEWFAVAIFPSRGVEPKNITPYEDLLQSKRVTRIFLDEYPMPADPPLGLGILQLVSAPPDQARDLIARLRHKAETKAAHGVTERKVIELVEELMIRRFPQLEREEVRKMFQLTDLRKTRVWQEAHDEGLEEGIEKGIEKGQAQLKKKFVRKLLASGMSVKEIAQLMETSPKEVRRLAKDTSA